MSSSESVQPVPADNEHNRLYKQAVDLVWPLLPLHGMPRHVPGFWARRRLRKGIALFERVLEIRAGNWAAMWIAGMSCRRLGQHDRAFEFLKRSAELSTNPDVHREASLSAMDTGRSKEAIAFAQRAISLDAHDPGLVANLALAHLVDQNPAEARRAAQYAVDADPKDKISRDLLSVIDEVIAGRRPCPRKTFDVRGSR